VFVDNETRVYDILVLWCTGEKPQIRLALTAICFTTFV